MNPGKHGGKREGAGRPRVLKDAVDVTVRLSRAELDEVDRWQERNGGSRAEAIRSMILVAALQAKSSR